MKRYTLKNSFHRTSVIVLVDDHMIDARQADIWHDIHTAAWNEITRPPFIEKAATAKRNRVQRTLCGVRLCGCHTVC